MPLDPVKLESDFLLVIRAAFKVDSIPAGQQKEDAENSYRELAAGLATAVQNYVIAGTVQTVSASPVLHADGTARPIDSLGQIT